MNPGNKYFCICYAIAFALDASHFFLLIANTINTGNLITRDISKTQTPLL